MKIQELMESPTADVKNLARSAARKFYKDEGSDKNPHPPKTFQHKVWQEAFNKEAKKIEKELEKEK